MIERKNVYKLPAGDKTLEWYSKAVAEMKRRPTTNPTSWNYQAAMHGFNASLSFWQGKGPFPGQSEQTQFWKQCQHGSWFFLPWHRMYLAYFEQIVAQTIVGLGGPAGWALPFWDYSDSLNPNARRIPGEFTTPASAANGLWIPQRSTQPIPERWVSLQALDTLPFTGDGRSSPLGFGGPETSFSHSGATHGEVESLPHDMVHVAIGGAMGDPRTAALDPIFWLHHANIDRLWQVWLNKGNRLNPTKSSWLDFKFNFHDKNGNTAQISCRQVLDTRRVLSGYTYEGFPTVAPQTAAIKKLKLVDFSMPLEVVAATNRRVKLESAKTVVNLPLSRMARNSIKFASTRKTLHKPQKTYLHFEHITGKGVPPIHDVYINLPAKNKGKEAYYAGSLPFFGVEEASKPNVHQSGSGQHYALEITELMNKLRSSVNLEKEQLDISIEPARKMDPESSVTIGRISLYSE